MTPQTQAEWNAENDLESPPNEPLSHYAARCLAYMFVRAGSSGREMIESLARAARVPGDLMLAAIESRRESNRDRKSKGPAKRISKSMPPAPSSEWEDSTPRAAASGTPNVESTPLPANLETPQDQCRCGNTLVVADWSGLGISGSPKICQPCGSFSRDCSCVPAKSKPKSNRGAYCDSKSKIEKPKIEIPSGGNDTVGGGGFAF